MHSPIFIGGLMKSGTTLLRVMLSKHPAIFSGLETHWFSNKFKVNYLDSKSKVADQIKVFYELSDVEYQDIVNSSSSQFTFLSRLMNFCTKQGGKQRWIEKTPDNIIHLKEISEFWPEAKVIYVKRDLRDIFSSWKTKKNLSVEYFIDKAVEVNDYIQTAKTPIVYETVWYEQLILDTEKTMKKVISFVGEEWIDGIASHMGDKTEYDKVKTATGKESPTLESTSKPIFTDSIGQFKRELTVNEINAIESLPFFEEPAI